MPTTRGPLYLARRLTKAGDWTEPEPVSRKEALHRVSRHYFDPETALRESSQETPARTPFAIYWRADK